MIPGRGSVRTKLVVALALLLTGLSAPAAAQTEIVMPEVLATYPHDEQAFTEGLVWHDGFLYEGTGLYGRSTLRKVDLASGESTMTLPLDPQYFGEGIAILNDTLYQLTWQENTGFVYDVETFGLQRTFTYEGEGWGLTTDGNVLIMSDGTPTLRVLDPTTLTVTATIDVTDQGEPVDLLNELEWVEGEIWASVWLTTLIARIDPATGDVTGWLDVVHLADAAALAIPGHTIDVANGTAYDAEARRLFVTGKFWPLLFEIHVPGLGPLRAKGWEHLR